MACIWALKRAQGYLRLPHGKAAINGFRNSWARKGKTTLFAVLRRTTGLVRPRITVSSSARVLDL